MSEQLSDDELEHSDASPGFGHAYGDLSTCQEVNDTPETTSAVSVVHVELIENDTWQARQVTLVAQAITGDEQAFALIADHYGNLLLRTAYLLVQDEEAAKDIVQDALLLAWRHMATLREPLFLRAWLLKIVVNQSTSLKRQWARKAALLREQFTQYAIDMTIQQSDFQRGHVEDRLDVEHAIEQLPLNQRIVLVLFYYHRMTIPEIATMLNASENTLRKRLQSALDKLRRVLQVEFDGEHGEPREHGISLTEDSVNAHVGLHRGGM